MDFTYILLTIVVGFWLVVAVRYFYSNVIPLCREPVFHRPVLIIESDDWSPGPSGDVASLGELAKILKNHTDYRGHPAVMTLGIVLSTPYEIYTNREGVDKIRRHFLTSSSFKDLVAVMQSGEQAGCFSLQLHAMDHFWPVSLIESAKNNNKISSWIKSKPFPRTEELPQQLQGRWTVNEQISLERISQADINKAVCKEVEAFRRFSGLYPMVVVPPAFIWTKVVESAWAKAGIKIVVTPGKRFESYDSNGRPQPCGGKIRNGDKSKSGLIYIVRDNYFEPYLGHKLEKAIGALVKKTETGRPTLIETHRYNFIKNSYEANNALKELDRFFERALKLHPNLIFLSTEKLADMMSRKDAVLISKSFFYRFPRWIARIEEDKHSSLAGWLSGLTPFFIFVHSIIQLVLKHRKQKRQLFD
ncbi:hypothetical protein [Desulfospira joergensenii]|uniref:hypothetical protein n=1 Tax=Desulfospira joergensenii TaxID=53329 RepID=UPI0003B6ABAD|nr:hypothetical protein [Desulfospira joergensenii]